MLVNSAKKYKLNKIHKNRFSIDYNFSCVKKGLLRLFFSY